ncbi:hypothetical protein V6Z12_A03G193100 [Gossypium hirsutum]
MDSNGQTKEANTPNYDIVKHLLNIKASNTRMEGVQGWSLVNLFPRKTYHRSIP